MEKFVLKFLWLEKSIAVALDQKIGERTTPLTEYYFWPSSDAWEEMKSYLENNIKSKNLITESECIILLNQLTEIINFWQEKDGINKKEILKVKEKFPQVIFVGHD